MWFRGLLPTIAALAALLVAAILQPNQPDLNRLLTAKLHPPPAIDCTHPARHGFIPTTIDIEHIETNLPVMALPRDSTNSPRTPPLAAKFTVAWDAPGNRPGGKYGNVLLNTHTWPDGSSLGNAMMAKTKVGDLFVLRRGSLKVCYRVNREVEVPADSDFPDFWVEDGPPQVAFIVCSGRRLGPGRWTKRTIWFAKEIAA